MPIVTACRYSAAMTQATSPSDRDILEAIGDAVLLANDVTAHCVKQWKYRGVPWRYRAKVAKLAASKRIKIPADFVEERRVTW